MKPNKLLCVLGMGCVIIACETAPPGPTQSAEVHTIQLEKRKAAESFQKEETAADRATAKTEAPPEQAPPPDASTNPPPKEIEPVPPKTDEDMIRVGALKLAEDALLGMDELLKGHVPGPDWKLMRPFLERASSYTGLKRRDHWRVNQNSEWKALDKQLVPILKRFSAQRTKSLERLRDILALGVSLVAREDGYERAAGYTLINQCLQTIGTRLPQTEKQKYLMPFVARYDLANKALERRLLLEILGRHGGRQLERYFAYVALDDPSVVVRKEALKSLKVCIESARGCTFDARTAGAIYNAHTDSRTRSALIDVAGLSQIRDVTSWCEAHVAHGPLAHACRGALSRVGTREAFNILYNWIVERKDSVESQTLGRYEFRDEFLSLVPYADRYFSKEKFYSLLQDVLGQDLRDGFVTGGIVRAMGSLKDKKRAHYIVKATRAFYKEKWGADPMHRGQIYLMKSLKEMERELARSVKNAESSR